ncbi:MAG: hypothetical protein ACYSRZ_04305 [Planctomycetota bacterium]|jgi:hypothetical protein
MFKAMQNVNVTEGDGVQDNQENVFLSEYFYVTGEVFKMNDYESTSEMEAVLDGKGGMIQ